MKSPEEPQSSHETSAHRLRVVDLHDPTGLLADVERRPDAVRTRFCAVADLRRGVPAGYEVLLEVAGREPLTPQALSQDVHAQAAGRLEAHLVERALQEREHLPPDTFLMVNV